MAAPAIDIAPATHPADFATARDLFLEYAALGFRETTAYYDNPLPGVRYFALDLGAVGSA